MRLSVLVLLVLLCNAPLHAAEPVPGALAKISMTTVPRGEPLPGWADPLLPIPAATSHDALVTRLSDIQVWTGSGPTAILYNRAIQVNHRAGLGEIGQFALHFLPSHQRLSLHRVALLRGGAVIDLTRTVNARVLERESELDNGMYGGEATVQLLLDDVRVGDTLWITYTITGDNPVFGAHWGDWFQWDTGWPVTQRRLAIRDPASKPLYWRQLGDVHMAALTPVIERRGAIERLRFDGRDIAPVEFERKTPAGFIPVRLIALSDFANWHEVALWATALFPGAPPSPQVTALAAQFRPAGDQAAQAAAALRWVQEEVRYFSVSIGENSHRPQAPDTVLARRYGDCKDKTYLLISILQALGIAAEPVLLNAGALDYPAKMAPTQNAFDHAIVRLHVAGQAYFVDPTATGQRGDLTQMAADFPRASVLIVAPATQALLPLPERVAALPSYERVELFKVPDLKGAAVLEARDIYRNGRADAARRKFGIMRPLEVGNDVLAHYERQYPGVTLLGTPVLVDDAPDGSFEVRARLAVPAAVRKVEDRYVLDYDSQVVDGTLGLPDKLVRQFPFSLPEGKVDARYRLRIQWPHNVHAHSPDAVQLVDHPYFSVRESYSMLGNEVDYLLDYRLKREQVAAADLPELQRAIRSTQGMLSGGFNDEGDDADDPGTPGLSVRDAAAEEQLRGMRAARADESADQIAKWGMDALCWHLRATAATMPLQPDDERAATRSQRDLFKQDQLPGANRCRGQLSLQDLDARASVDWFARDTLGKSDRLHLQSSWAHWYAGQHDAALAEAMAYVAAARASGKLNGGDLALAISLHVRAGKPVPAVLQDTFVLPGDAPWPAPLLAWQRGKSSDAALFAIVAGYAPEARALALNDAWFHVGVRRLASQDAAGAAAAFRWYLVDGVRGTLPYVLAGLERQASASRDPDLAAGQALADAGKLAEAAQAWRAAAARGDAEAQALLGAALVAGRGVAKDPDAARQFLEPAARAGSGMAAYRLALLEKPNAPGSKARGIAYLQQAVALGYPRALYHVSSLYRRDLVYPPDPARGVELERQAAELGYPAAQAVHAFSYLRGTGVARSDALVRYWANRAIVNGNDDGYAALAGLLMRGTPEDQRAALNMVRNLADAGNHMAMVVMGHAAMRGLGQPADLAAARGWYVKVQQKDGATSLAALSDVLGLWEDDKDSAFDVQQLAAAEGDARAQVGLSWSYRHGDGTPADQVQAMRWLRAAAQQGDLTAINNLGDAYETGAGVPVDLVQAMTLYRQAAQQGGAAAFFSLASVHERGVGMPPDLRVAYTYRLLRQRFIEAAEPGAEVEPATSAMGARLSPQDQAQARAVADAWQPGQPLPGDVASR